MVVVGSGKWSLQVPRVLCEQWKVGDICVHGPVIPGAGTRDATLEAGGSSLWPLLPLWSRVREQQS